MESEDHIPVIEVMGQIVDSIICIEKSETLRGNLGNLLQNVSSTLKYFIAVSPRENDPKTPVLERSKYLWKLLQTSGLVEPLPSRQIYNKLNESPALKQLKNLWNNLKQQFQSNELNVITSKPKNTIKELNMRDVWDCLGSRQPTSPNPSRMAFQKLLDREVQNVCDTANEYLSQKNWFNVSNLKELHSNLVLDMSVARGTLREDVTVGSYLFFTTYRTFLPPEEIETGMNILIEALNSEEAITNPILRAYYAYSGLIFFIHPFEDGNGRVGRIICNMLLVEGGYPTAVVSNDKTLTLVEFIKKVAEAY